MELRVKFTAHDYSMIPQGRILNIMKPGARSESCSLAVSYASATCNKQFSPTTIDIANTFIWAWLQKMIIILPLSFGPPVRVMNGLKIWRYFSIFPAGWAFISSSVKFHIKSGQIKLWPDLWISTIICTVQYLTLSWPCNGIWYRWYYTAKT